jgi:hypothetical protein
MTNDQRMKQELRQIVRSALVLARHGQHPRVADIVRSYLRGEWMTEAAEIAAYLIDDEDDDSALLAAISAVSGRLEWDYDHSTKTARWADGREASVWLEAGTLQMVPTI